MNTRRVIRIAAISGTVVLLLWLAYFMATRQASTPTETQQEGVPEVTLVDGSNEVAWLGIYHASPIVDGMKSYTSERLGISFKYPSDYVLFEHEGDGVSFDGSINIAREDLRPVRTS
jgi:hypothetical protein